VRYVYDGQQAIQEISDSDARTLLTGLSIDEVIANYSQTGDRIYLTDALGSVIAQTNADQSLQNFYSYTPFGETSILGPDFGNAIQYTARENDGTGLYYYRARYYDPLLKQFLAEDPLGIAVSLNFYTYVDDAPTMYADALGLAGTPPRPPGRLPPPPRPPNQVPTIPPPQRPPPPPPGGPGISCGAAFRICSAFCIQRCPGGIPGKAVCELLCVLLYLGCLSHGGHH
jgi:RHS repeat-associated protein